ncbi:hypothetical protein BUH_6745 [Burkholderia pseudomallei Pakistan 9]|nr:hypothetical protein BUH_6745 [Burkholderia pseudomallei Pakistan 9]
MKIYASRPDCFIDGRIRRLLAANWMSVQTRIPQTVVYTILSG